MGSPGPAGGADVEASLRETRSLIADLAVADGSFTVACRETGVRPTPVTGVTFDDYEDAERARAAATAYRDALREVDPDLPAYDLDVCECSGPSVEFVSVRHRTGDRRANGLPRTRRTVTVAGARNDEWLRVENAPVVHFQGPDRPLDDDVVARQLDAKLD